MMKKMILTAMAAVMLTAGVAMAADNAAGLNEYRVIGEMPVALGQIIDLFIPSLSGGQKFLAPKVNGLGLVRQWNPQFAGATWETKIQPGAILRFPREWVLRGIQGVLEPIEAPRPLNWNPTPVDGKQTWGLICAIVLMFVAAIIFAPYLSRLFDGRRQIHPNPPL